MCFYFGARLCESERFLCRLLSRSSSRSGSASGGGRVRCSFEQKKYTRNKNKIWTNWLVTLFIFTLQSLPSVHSARWLAAVKAWNRRSFEMKYESLVDSIHVWTPVRPLRAPLYRLEIRAAFHPPSNYSLAFPFRSILAAAPGLHRISPLPLRVHCEFFFFRLSEERRGRSSRGSTLSAPVAWERLHAKGHIWTRKREATDLRQRRIRQREEADGEMYVRIRCQIRIQT